MTATNTVHSANLCMGIHRNALLSGLFKLGPHGIWPVGFGCWPYYRADRDISHIFFINMLWFSISSFFGKVRDEIFT